MITSPFLTLSQKVMLGIILAVFAYVGLRRGANRELLATLGIVLGMLFSVPLAEMLTPWVNRFYRLGRFALSGGIFSDDPGAAWQEARGVPDLIGTTFERQAFVLVTFFVIVLSFYLMGRWRVPLGKTMILRLLGLLAGAINGFLVAYFLSPYLLSVPITTIVLPSQELRTTLTARHNVALVVFVFVGIMIAFGLYNATGSRKR